MKYFFSVFSKFVNFFEYIESTVYEKKNQGLNRETVSWYTQKFSECKENLIRKTFKIRKVPLIFQNSEKKLKKVGYVAWLFIKQWFSKTHFLKILKIPLSIIQGLNRETFSSYTRKFFERKENLVT